MNDVTEKLADALRDCMRPLAEFAHEELGSRGMMAIKPNPIGRYATGEVGPDYVTMAENALLVAEAALAAYESRAQPANTLAEDARDLAEGLTERARRHGGDTLLDAAASASIMLAKKAQPASVRYWLCCGSTAPKHGEKFCVEAQSGHPERVRFGTQKEHSDWQRSQQAAQPASTPAVVASNTDADAANKTHGERYGIDWVYPASVADGIRTLQALWRRTEHSDEPQTEFDKGYEQASRECADSLEVMLASAPQPQAQPAAVAGGFSAKKWVSEPRNFHLVSPRGVECDVEFDADSEHALYLRELANALIAAPQPPAKENEDAV